MQSNIFFLEEVSAGYKSLTQHNAYTMADEVSAYVEWARENGVNASYEGYQRWKVAEDVSPSVRAHGLRPSE